MQLIDGKAVAAQVKQEIAAQVAQMVEKGLKRPHLAAILVGHDGGSETYVRNKVIACEEVKRSKKLLKLTLDVGGEERTVVSGIKKWYKPEELVGKTLMAIVNLPPRKMMGLESCGMLISAVHKEKGEEKLNLLILDDAIPAGAVMC